MITNNLQNIILRPLLQTDYLYGYCDLLSQLTNVGNITKTKFDQQFEFINKHGELINIIVLFDTQKSKIIGNATLLVEPKFIHLCGKVGHIEDVVVDINYRKHSLGKLLVNHLIEIGKKAGCYKLILDCKTDIMPFYVECGFNQVGSEMAKYFS